MCMCMRVRVYECVCVLVCVRACVRARPCSSCVLVHTA